jgi:hypothetical protein
MKNQKQTSILTRSCLALAMTLAICSPVPGRSEAAAGGEKMTDSKMMEQCKEMKDEKAKMNADIKAQDVSLTGEIAAMNSAPQDKKSELMAAIITKMVEQRTATDERKAKMEEEMMNHMMQHMHMGKESMAQCPMMKGMKGMKEKPDGDHKEHHQEQK